jgi:hypothetical protein
MARRRALYSFVMVTIYVVATMLSSLSLIFCDHHHPHHHHHSSECGAAGCDCGAGVTLSADCCDHHHPILGDNHTDYIDSSNRHNSRASHALALMMAPVVVGNVMNEQLLCRVDFASLLIETDYGLPSAVYISSAGLRAPPCLA